MKEQERQVLVELCGFVFGVVMGAVVSERSPAEVENSLVEMCPRLLWCSCFTELADSFDVVLNQVECVSDFLRVIREVRG